MATSGAPRYNAGVPVYRHAPLLGFLLLTACAEWPRFQHLPDSADTGALPAGADPSLAIRIDWQGPTDHVEEGTATGLPMGERRILDPDGGLLVEGLLEGSGWSDTATPLEGDCGPLSFPLDGAGTYLGDVDWVAVKPAAPGLLCAELQLDREEVQLDVVPYLLDSCDDPAVVMTDGQGAAIGAGFDAPKISWSASVQADKPLGVAIAAYWPQAPELKAGWRLALSLVEGTVCPVVPEQP